MKCKYAKYRCLKCGYEWEQQPQIVDCPICDHNYVKWLNYEEWRKENMTYPYT